jgi:hypothetical protein
LQKQKKSNFSSLFVVGVIGLVATWLLLWKGVPVIVPIIVHPRSNEPQRRPLPPSRRAPASCSGTKRNRLIFPSLYRRRRWLSGAAPILSDPRPRAAPKASAKNSPLAAEPANAPESAADC